MSRLSILVAVAMLSVGGQTFGQEVKSYHASGSSPGFTVIDSVPAGGLVLTDFVFFVSGGYNVFENGTRIHRAVTAPDGSTSRGVHLNSGVPVAAGSAITVTHGVGGTPAMTISGYIPTGAGSVPAVSTWGLIVMAMLMLSAGTLVMTRRKPVVA